MDFKSLSLFMQTSLAYECTVCKLYFGTENQLLAHHKRSHSKRLKVSLNPQLNWVEDEDYIIANSQDETSLTSPSSTSRNDANSQGLNEEDGVARLENNEVGSGTTSNCTDSNDGLEYLKSQNDQESLDSNNKGPLKRSVDACTDQHDGAESPLKRVKTETESDNANQDSSTQEGSSSSASDKTKDSEQGSLLLHQYSDSMKDTIEHGQYGYLIDYEFHRFSLEELKKFAVQVVALFKLDESHQNSKSLPIPVIQNDITASSMEFEGIPAASNEASCMETGNALDDPNKSCYKCGELGHFAWGCTNPRKKNNKRRQLLQIVLTNNPAVALLLKPLMTDFDT